MKIIVALDFKTQEEAFTLLEDLDPQKWILKVGLEMFSRFGPDFVHALHQKGYLIFLDLKFHDIPNTVAQAINALTALPVWMINVHASGGLAMMKAAREALNALGKNRPLLIAVTVLTSDALSTQESQRVGDLALLAMEAGLDGVVCSAFEVPLVKKLCGPSFLTITPGIRLDADAHHDQKRVATVQEAVDLGSDYLVIGRSITKAADPKKIIDHLLGFID